MRKKISGQRDGHFKLFIPWGLKLFDQPERFVRRVDQHLNHLDSKNGSLIGNYSWRSKFKPVPTHLDEDKCDWAWTKRFGQAGVELLFAEKGAQVNRGVDVYRLTPVEVI